MINKINIMSFEEFDKTINDLGYEINEKQLRALYDLYVIYVKLYESVSNAIKNNWDIIKEYYYIYEKFKRELGFVEE